MKAILYTKYGLPGVLQLKEIAKPLPKDDEILVKVCATSVNRTDYATIRAIPFIARLFTGFFSPKRHTPGTEFSGIVERIGSGVTGLKQGDRVFGFDDTGSGSHAQFLVTKEVKALLMPDSVSFEQMGAGQEGAYYAYNFINKVKLEKGQDFLVNGATGAIGSAAVQLLKYYGANVTAVCAAKNRSLAISLGADIVIDYTTEDFTKRDQKYHYVFDTVGKSSFFKCFRILRKGGVYISSDLGYLSQNIFLPMITPLLKLFLSNKKTVGPFPDDLRGSMELLKELVERGRFKSVVDRNYPFEDIVDAYWYVGKGQKIGNVSVSIE